MLQTIAAICSIASFILGYPALGVVLCLVVVIILLVKRRHQSQKIDKFTIFQGEEWFPSPDSGATSEVFFPKPFKFTPKLNVEFPKRRVRGRHGLGVPRRPEYKLEQRPDGFKVQLISLAGYEPIFKWKAEGQLADNNRGSEEQKGHIIEYIASDILVPNLTKDEQDILLRFTTFPKDQLTQGYRLDWIYNELISDVPSSTLNLFLENLLAKGFLERWTTRGGNVYYRLSDHARDYLVNNQLISKNGG